MVLIPNISVHLDNQDEGYEPIISVNGVVLKELMEAGDMLLMMMMVVVLVCLLRGRIFLFLYGRGRSDAKMQVKK